MAHALAIHEHDRGALADRQLPDRIGDQPLALVALVLRGRIARRVGKLAGRFECDPGRTAFAVETKIDDDAREPGAEFRHRLPARRIGPDPEQRFLSDIFGVSAVPQNAGRQRGANGRVAPRKNPERGLFSASDARHKRFVAVCVHFELRAIIPSAR